MRKKCVGLLLLGWLWPFFGAYGQTETYRVAILDEPTMPVEGQKTPIETFETAWKPEGIEVVRLDAAHLADPQGFNEGLFDLLVIPTGASFPMAAKGTLLGFPPASQAISRKSPAWMIVSLDGKPLSSQ